ncbi:MAG: NOB1 family endonuclease [Candidatus Heimdallarchaeota archaeon]
MRSHGLHIYILDSTAFIRLDFPDLLLWGKSTSIEFYTTPNIVSELKDFRSKTNLDLLSQSTKFRITEPSASLVRKVKQKIQVFDPQTALSYADIGVISLAIELRDRYEAMVALITSDYRLQNAAGHLKVPIHTMTNQKILQLHRWQLKCRSCGEITNVSGQICPSCGGQLSAVRLSASRGNIGGKE